MKKFSILALALALCAAMFTGCTGTLTDETGNTSDTGSVTTTAPTSKPTTAPTTPAVSEVTKDVVLDLQGEANESDIHVSVTRNGTSVFNQTVVKGSQTITIPGETGSGTVRSATSS